MLNMNIEYTGRLHEVEKIRRFAGKVYDRIARPSRIMLFAFIAAAGVVEVLSYLRRGHLDYYLVFLLALIFFCLKFNRARYQKSIDLVTRRFMGDSDEWSITMTDACYEFRSGDNVMRVGWRNLGSYYLFLDGGLAVLERKMPRLLLPSLSDLGANVEEVKSALEKAGLKDYRHCRSYWWVFVLLAALMGGVVAQFDLMQSRAKMPASVCVECDDEEADEEDENPFADDDSGGGKSRQFSLGDIDFDSRRISIDYELAETRSSTNREQISYQDFANIIAVLREQRTPKHVSMMLSIADVNAPARPLETLATLTNSQLSVNLVLYDCTNLTDVAILGRVPMTKLSLCRCPVGEIRGLEQCPLEALEIYSCPVKSIENICPLPRLRKMCVSDTPMAQPTKEALGARWKGLDYLRFAPQCENEPPKFVVVSMFSETDRFQEAVAEADRVVIRDGGFGCCTKPERDPVLLVLTDTKEIAELRGIFKFKDRGSNSECMCCGHPGIDWWKGDELLARTAVQHLTALRWKRFHGDAELTSEAAEALTAWFAARNIKAAK
jgi:hypothetical protein